MFNNFSYENWSIWDYFIKNRQLLWNVGLFVIFIRHEKSNWCLQQRSEHNAYKHACVSVYWAFFYSLFDVHTGCSAAAVPEHTNAEASFPVSSRRHGHESDCVRQRVGRRVSRAAPFQHRGQNLLLIAFATTQTHTYRHWLLLTMTIADWIYGGFSHVILQHFS